MFAILMLFIAPVVSRSLEHARAGSAERPSWRTAAWRCRCIMTCIRRRPRRKRPHRR
ncbi:hypothetical protein [Serratia ureilytica]|uniref:hypothetical protein n=1 Tax=Serratia ureilytica TaxID=300181 RepID=UPI002F961A9E